MDSKTLYITLTLMLPLLGGLVAYFTGVKHAAKVSLVGMLPGAVVSVLLLLLCRDTPVTLRWEWMPGFTLGWRVDHISAVLVCLVYFISLLVYLFSAHYLKSDPAIHRYYAKLGFFTTSMLGLLLADHLLLLFVFWELVGFSSYLLIGFWFADQVKAKSAREAFMVNRVADAGLLIGVILMITELGQPFLSEMTGQPASFIVNLAGFGLMIGALGKSAQFPFFGWLPKAMAGPTPVSALIHAATMVAAGVYLLVRVAPILTPVVLSVIAVIGALTALMAAVAALSQFDIKKVLAYSTISQLGYMVMGIGVGAADSSLFHLWTHAFFKAGLFLGAGAVIHYYHRLHHDDHSFDTQDMRQMGGLRKMLPITFISFVICGLALSGLPFFSGFLSKEGILTNAWIWAAGQSNNGYWMAYAVSDMAFITALITPIYIGRQILLVFFGSPRSAVKKLIGMEPMFTLKMPLILLAVGSVWFLHALNPLDANGWWLSGFMFGEFSEPASGNIPMYTMVLSIALAVAGLAIAYMFFGPKSTRVTDFKNASAPHTWYGSISYQSWYIEPIYDQMAKGYSVLVNLAKWVDVKIIDRCVNSAGVWSVVLSKVLAIIDREIIDGLVNFIAWLSKGIGNMFTGIQSGKVQNQLVWMITILLILILWFQF
ncbi:MAG: NADH-quinone oxidoreductase subunit L [Marinoscillum sp.]